MIFSGQPVLRAISSDRFDLPWSLLDKQKDGFRFGEKTDVGISESEDEAPKSFTMLNSNSKRPILIGTNALAFRG
jgi:hypothetical protein